MTRVTYQELGRPEAATTVIVPRIGEVVVTAQDIKLANNMAGNGGWKVIERQAKRKGRSLPHILGRMYPTEGITVSDDQTDSYDDLGRPTKPCVRPIRNFGWVQVTDKDIKAALERGGHIRWRLYDNGGLAREKRVMLGLAQV